MTKLVAAALGVEPCFVSPPWTEVTAGNWGDRWDIAYGSGAITADRMQRLYMTQPYYTTAKPLLRREGLDVPGAERPRRQEDRRVRELLTGGVPEGRARASRHRRGRRRVTSPEIVVFEVEPPGLDALEKGTVDAFLAGDPVGRAPTEDGAALRAARGGGVQRVLVRVRGQELGTRGGRVLAKVDEIVWASSRTGPCRSSRPSGSRRTTRLRAAEFDLEALDQNVE